MVLANATLRSESTDELKSKIKYTIGKVGIKLKETCKDKKSYIDVGKVNIEDCEQAEYDVANEFIRTIDLALRETNYEALIVGSANLQDMLNSRISKLFADQLCCHEEAQTIKKIYM